MTASAWTQIEPTVRAISGPRNVEASIPMYMWDAIGDMYTADRLARARREVAPRPPDCPPNWQCAVLAHRACCRRLQRVTVGHLRRPGRTGELHLPDGGAIPTSTTGHGASDEAAQLGAKVVGKAGKVLEPRDVAVIALAAIEEEAFLIFPHPEVLEHWPAQGI